MSNRFSIFSKTFLPLVLILVSGAAMAGKGGKEDYREQSRKFDDLGSNYKASLVRDNSLTLDRSVDAAGLKLSPDQRLNLFRRISRSEMTRDTVDFILASSISKNGKEMILAEVAVQNDPPAFNAAEIKNMSDFLDQNNSTFFLGEVDALKSKISKSQSTFAILFSILSSRALGFHKEYLTPFDVTGNDFKTTLIMELARK